MSFESPLPLLHSWPLYELGARFDLGALFDPAAARLPAFAHSALADQGIGLWECDLLAGNRLRWSTAVYDLFGLPQEAVLRRDETAALYAEGSRVQMERLRAYAIRHQRGFTIDAELRPACGGPRWMRLTAAPVVVDGQVVRLHGIKRDVTADYR